MKFGAVLNYAPELITKPDWSGLKNMALKLEEWGYDSVWVMDHFDYHGSPSVLECYTTMAALAACTSKIRVGTLVSCNSYRSPPLAAKMGATLDLISNGRFNFGIGAGWKRDEYEMYGYDFPSAATRIDQLRESVQLVKRIWTEPSATVTEGYYRISDMKFGPTLIQKPHPPIWIGGGGEKRTLKVVAELADYSNLGQDMTREEYRHKTEVLKQHCHTVGRKYADIQKSLALYVLIGPTRREALRKMASAYDDYLSHPPRYARYPSTAEEYKSKRLVGTPEDCALQLGAWLELDVDYVMVGWTMGLPEWKLFAERVIPGFQ
jgi:alkanesulfonate monooxygenase SsuD/methylene tetrahydromethanopterin reductase-like flavin-dependent oxidoreductase (luciferase family)